MDRKDQIYAELEELDLIAEARALSTEEEQLYCDLTSELSEIIKAEGI